MKTIYCLYEFSGRLADQYRRLGYEVHAVDLILGNNIFDFDYRSHTNVVGIVSHPPCTEFARSGARWWPTKSPDLLTQAVRQVEIVLEIVKYHRPEFWFIENPIGRIQRYVELGKPRLSFDPYEYAGYLNPPWSDVYTKRTQLWGEFVVPPKRPVDVTPASACHLLSSADKMTRSLTPLGFARAFVEYNQP